MGMILFGPGKGPPAMRWLSKLSYQRKSEVFGFLLVILCLFTILSLATHSVGDDRWIWADSDEVWVDSYRARNMAGTVGALLSGALLERLGYSSWALALLMGAVGLRRFMKADKRKPFRTKAGVFVGIFLFGVMIDLPAAGAGGEWSSGVGTLAGSIGRAVGVLITRLLGVIGGMLVIGSALAGGLMLVVPWKRLRIRLPAGPRSTAAPRKKKARIDWGSRLLRGWVRIATPVWTKLSAWRLPRRAADALAVDEMTAPDPSENEPVPDHSHVPNWATYQTPRQEGTNEAHQAELPLQPAELRPRAVVRTPPDGNYRFPSLELLEEAEPHHRHRGGPRGAELLRNALKTFDIGIEGDIKIYPGPVITRYEFRPAPGVKVNQVVGLADDLALALSASRVRIVAPVPGKAAVGIEVPNREPEIVGLRRVLETRTFLDSDAALPLALGESTDGKPFVADLASMPHLLIAGATGSGKSVCINAIIASLLFRSQPTDVRLLFIDPKRLELSVYSGIPHMARPVVTDPRAAERLLAGAAKEMDDRYQRLAAAGVRNVVDFNQQAEPEARLPYTIIVVDELADLMMSQSAPRIELLITRIAQMARAVGIHLILATQRPSVDVITGLIKANFSCRIAFQVASKTDSRTILDANGAEKLLGNGDMLYLSPGQPQPLRVHGAFISAVETKALVEFLRTQDAAVEGASGLAAPADGSGDDQSEPDETADPLFLEAAEVVTRHKQGSVSLLQRRLGIGYQRAARLIDRLEEARIVGPYDGSKAREVLITASELEERYAKSVN